MAQLKLFGGGFAILSCMLLLAICDSPPASGQMLDEAQKAGRKAATFPQADEDYFHDMDNGVALTPEEVKGRNMWLVWTGGNDRQWDTLATSSTLGYHDLLKVVTSHPSQTYCYGPCNRDTRWHWLGAVNEPCFEKPAGPDPDRFGLWLDVRRKDCPPDPFENEANYPGVKIGARGQPIGGGKILPVGSYFGYASGIVGLRLFPNPNFDENAAKHWNPERYYTDPDYYNDPKLVRPYRVGMSCAMCHVSPSPIHPPADPSHPQWADLNSTRGAQYLWFGRLFAYRTDLTNFVHQVTNTYAPGTTETSLVSTDYINNPRSNNAIYNLGARLALAHRWGKETLKGGELNNKQLPGFFDPPDTAWSPRVLKDGAELGRRVWGAEPCLCEYRALQRRLVHTFQSQRRGQADFSIPHQERRGKFRLLAGDRGGRPIHSEILSESGSAGPPKGRPWRGQISDGRHSDAGARQDQIRGNLRAVPFEQTARRRMDEIGSGRMFRSKLSHMLETLLGLHEDRRVQGEDARNRRQARFPR